MELQQEQQWPKLPYDEFKTTSYLLHRAVQVIGKLKLLTPFEPQWANVILHLTARGLTSGPIYHNNILFNIDLDFINHEVILAASNGKINKFPLESMSVAKFTNTLLALITEFGIEPHINLMPQEVPQPIRLDQDKEIRIYNPELAHAWWKIMLQSYVILQQYHAKFTGKTPPIGLMWGTFDLRDARYNGVAVATSGINSDYIRRNAMNEAQVEAGWWPGDERYPHAAYFSFIHPQSPQIELAEVKPKAAYWEKNLGEFILKYDDVRKSTQPNLDLLDFFESTYQASAHLGNWDTHLVTVGKPN